MLCLQGHVTNLYIIFLTLQVGQNLILRTYNECSGYETYDKYQEQLYKKKKEK